MEQSVLHISKVCKNQDPSVSLKTVQICLVLIKLCWSLFFINHPENFKVLISDKNR